ncbi:MAG: hypothetical protein J7K13_03735, partial [Thermoplasmata archaeon]|nr:hypothetical protein [Thermoplasmata archaeon]
MAEESEDKKKKIKGLFKKKKDKTKKNQFIKELKIAYRSIEDFKKFLKTVLLPFIFLGILVWSVPFILPSVLPFSIDLDPITFIAGGLVPIILGIFYPYINWKNRENDINGKMHYFITHIRVLAISDLSLKDIINMIGGK